VKQGVKAMPSRRTAVTRERGAELQRFESLVDGLSAAMARAPAESVDGEIKVWLEQICLTLDLDRSAIYEREALSKQVRVAHTWVRANFQPFPRDFSPAEKVKNATDWVMAGNELVWSRPTELPAQWEDLRRFVERYGPKASAIFPMWAGGSVIGGASFGRFRSSRQWHPRLLQQLGIAVRTFGGAIERKPGEMATEALRSELMVAQRRSMAGELVGSLAHEMNQPLTGILSTLQGLARLISQSPEAPSLARNAVKNAVEDAKRAAAIVRRVRGMFNRGGTQKRALDVSSLVKEAIELVGNESALRGIAVRFDASPKVPRVLADRIQIQQCLLNLLMNSFDAVARVKSRSPEVTICTAPENHGWIELSVHDNGAGVEPAVANRLFEPFVTTKPGGMGLGLLVTRSIVESHGGKLLFNENPDGGTTVRFTLPRARRAG